MESQNDSRTTIEYDDILEEIGETGKYQKFIYVLICIPLLLAGANIMSFSFASRIPNYRCMVPECEDPSNTTYDRPWFDSKVINEMSYYDQLDQLTSDCSRYVPLPHSTFNEKCPISMFSKERQSCSEWVFDESERTMYSDLQIACENTAKIIFIPYSFLIGSAAGALVCGILADCFGRKLILIVCTLIMSIAGILLALSKNFPIAVALRVFSAFGFSGIRLLTIIYGIELVGKKNRELASILPHLFFIVGQALMAQINYLIRNWITLQLIVSIPGFLIVFYYWIVPESPRWLLARKKISDAEIVIKRAARINKVTLSTPIKESFQHLSSSQTIEYKEARMLKVFVQTIKWPKVVLRFLTLLTIWYLDNAASQSIARYSFTSLGWNDYTTKTFNTLILLPVYIVTWICMKTIGGKLTLVSSLIFCGVCSFLTFFRLRFEIIWLETVMYLLNLLAFNCVSGVLYLYTAELLPTTLRCSGVGLASVAASIPLFYFQVTSLFESIYEYLPLIVFGFIWIILGVVAKFLPETREMTKLPDTAEDVKNI